MDITRYTTNLEQFQTTLYQNIEKKWTMPIPNWAKIRNQVAIRFEGRYPL